MVRKCLFLVFIISLVSCSLLGKKEIADPVVSIEELKTHMNVLASDKMNGRETFSTEITEAENYIVDQYKKMGLKAFPEFPNYKHTFTLYNYDVDQEKSKLQINSSTLSDVVFIAEKEVEKISVNNFRSLVVNENPRTVFSNLKSIQENTIIWLHPKFKSFMDRASGYFLRGKTTTEAPSEKIIIIAISEPIEIQHSELRIITKTKKVEASNTLAYLEGSTNKNEFIMFGAHHDHIGRNEQSNGDKVFNGANDNASGTTAVLALARYYVSRGDNQRSIIFSTFTAEEKGLVGSEILANQFPVPLTDIKAFINMEMLGKESDWGKKSIYMTGYERTNLASLMSASGDSTLIKLYKDPYPTMNLFYRSDNAEFAKKGVVAHSISSTGMTKKPNTYHQLTDEISTIDFVNMRDIIQGITTLSRTLVSGEATPKYY